MMRLHHGGGLFLILIGTAGDDQPAHDGLPILELVLSHIGQNRLLGLQPVGLLVVECFLEAATNELTITRGNVGAVLSVGLGRLDGVVFVLVLL